MKNVLVASIIVLMWLFPSSSESRTNLSSVGQPVAGQLNGCPSIPDISRWTVANLSRIVLAISDNPVAYIGLETEYNNPANNKEFVRVISRHIPMLISRQEKKDTKLFSEMVISVYNEKEELDKLKEVSDKSDPIVYVHWRIKKNLWNGRDARDGDANICIRSFDGTRVEYKNELVNIEFSSENVGNGKRHNVFIGMKYRVGNTYHIIRIDRDDLANLLKKDK